jgi:hypothetical protein
VRHTAIELIEATTEHWRLLQGAFGAGAIGVYLVGSAALGDFQPGRSDVDTITVIAQPFTEADHPALRDIHRAIAARFPDTRYDTTYVPIAWLSAPPEPRAVTPFSVNGELRLDQPAGQVHPVQWIEIAEHGIHCFGPEISELAIAIDRAAARDYVRENLTGYWGGQVAAVRAAIDANREIAAEVLTDAVTWLVLGAPRLAAFLESDAIISKSTAAQWVAARHPKARDLADRCLAHRQGKPASFTRDDLRRSADLVAMLIEGYASGTV